MCIRTGSRQPSSARGASSGSSGRRRWRLASPFAYLRAIAFAFVLLLGVLLFSKHPVGRFLAVGALWFAVLGGAVSIAFFLLGLIVPLGSLLIVSTVGVGAMAISVAGVLIKFRAPS